MLTIKQGEFLIKLARKTIENCFAGKEEKISEGKSKDKAFQQKQGVFVTLHSYPSMDLRGCIGFPYPIMPLEQAIIDAAKSSAFRDTRFAPLAKEELKKIIIEISVLSVPELINCNPEMLEKNVKAGKDGLICSFRGMRGLLLPQVALEQKWNAKQFIEYTCLKTGLSKDAWKNKDCEFFKFQAQIFSETKPNGKIIEKKE